MPGKKQKPKILDTTAPDGAGQINLPNPGEYPPDGTEIGLRRNTLGAFPPQGHRAGGGTTLGPGERVAIRRQLEFSAGGRSQLLQGGPLSPAAPYVSPKTGQVQISSTEDVDQSAGNMDRPAQPPQPPPARDDIAISTTDGKEADDSSNAPDRRRDREGI